MYRENGGAGPEIVPTVHEFPWWVEDLALALLIVLGCLSLNHLIDRWEQASLNVMNVQACTVKR